MWRRSIPGIVFLSLLFGALPLAAQRRPHSEAAAAGPAIAELHVAVQDLATKKQRGYVRPGEVLTLEVGERVRLRMVAIPEARNRAPRYPSTRFGLLAGKARVALSNIDEKVGSVDVTAVRSDNPGNEGATTLISYEILEPLDIKPARMGGTVAVKVVAPPPPPEPVREPARPETRRGVTLYEHQGYRGNYQKFYDGQEVPELRGSIVGQDAASSVRVDPGCRVTLWEHPSYEGRSSEVTADVEDLGRTRVGNDTVSSLRVDCGGGSSGGGMGGGAPAAERRLGVTLYEQRGFRGRSQTFYDGDRISDLRGTLLGADVASSLRVDPGCQVTLYEGASFTGRSTILARDLEDLGDSRVGDDTVSSLVVACRREVRPR